MRAVISRSLMPERSANESTTRLHSFANSRTIFTLGSLFLSSLVSPFVVAQVTPPGKVQLSPEAMEIHLRAKRPVVKEAPNLERAVSPEAEPSFNSAQGPGPGPIGPGPGCDLFPAPASVGAAVPLSYFGPPPSTTNPSLAGPVQTLNIGPYRHGEGHNNDSPVQGKPEGLEQDCLVRPH